MSEKNQMIDNPRLKELLQKRTKISEMSDQEYQNYLNEVTFEIAERARFYCLLIMTDEEVQKQQSYKFVQFHDEDNNCFLGAFTDRQELFKAPDARNGNARIVVMNFSQYINFISQKKIGIVINPYDENLKLSYELAMQMKEQSDFYHESLKKKTEEDVLVQINNFQKLPQQAVSALSRLALKEARIKKMWLKAMIKDDQQIMLVIVESSEDDDEIFKAVLSEGSHCTPEGMNCQVASYHSAFGREAADNEPFYLANDND